MKSAKKFPLILLIFLLALAACSSGTGAATTNVGSAATQAGDVTGENGAVRPANWSDASHSSDVEPNYDVVFPDDKVNQITITIAPDDWAAMQANMVELLGEPGQQNQRRGGFAPPQAGEQMQPPAGDMGDMAGRMPPGGMVPGDMARGEMGPGGISFLSENPMWVPATITFDGQTWDNVGVRYKGNSSLQTGWRSGSNKLPFKFDFDEFEDEYPEINNQRFFGFKQLSLANGFADDTYMRDALTYDLLAEAGLVAAETAFYEVILDYGAGPVNLGIYIAIEVIDDTVVERVFGSDEGNIYEGDGAGAALAAGTFDQIAASFQKENNKDAADWSDLEALYTVLHADERTADPAAWRADLETFFDVDNFLKWLALSAALQHWDAYGSMSHNFYLYNNPETGQLTWISWDHNQVLGGMPGDAMGGFAGDAGGRLPDAPEDAAAGLPGGPGEIAGRRGGMGGFGSVSLDKADVGDNWPLIRYLLDDPVYAARYLEALAEVDVLFDADELAAQYQAWADLLAPYVIAEKGETVWETAVQQLITRTYEQDQAVSDFLAAQ